MNHPEISREQWLALVKEHKESDMTQKEFCKEKNISLTRFGYYVQIYRNQDSCAASKTASFSAVSVHAKVNSELKEIKIELPNGFKCQTSLDVNPEHLKKLLGALLSC